MSEGNGQHEPDCSAPVVVDVPRARTEPMTETRWRGGIVNPKNVGALVVFVLGALILFGASWASTTASDADLENAVHEHEQRGEHPRLEKRLDAIEAEVKAVRETQINHGATLNAIHDQLRSLQRDRRNGP